MIELREMLDVLIDRAPALRTAGVLRVATGAVQFELAPASPREPTKREVEEAEQAARAASPSNPLDDPMTYGRTRAPGYDIGGTQWPRRSDAATTEEVEDEHDA